MTLYKQPQRFAPAPRPPAAPIKGLAVGGRGAGAQRPLARRQRKPTLTSGHIFRRDGENPDAGATQNASPAVVHGSQRRGKVPPSELGANENPEPLAGVSET